MKKYMLLMALMMTGCNELVGITEVFQTFSFNSTQGVQQAQVGKYKTELGFKKNTIKVKAQSEKGQIKFEINHNGQIPQNGEFTIPAQQSGQPFDIQGFKNQTVTRSKKQTQLESCTYQTIDTVCTPQGCFPQQNTRYGSKQIEFFFETENTKVDLNLFNASSKLAAFAADQTTTRKVITRETTCF